MWLFAFILDAFKFIFNTVVQGILTKLNQFTTFLCYNVPNGFPWTLNKNQNPSYNLQGPTQCECCFYLKCYLILFCPLFRSLWPHGPDHSCQIHKHALALGYQYLLFPSARSALPWLSTWTSLRSSMEFHPLKETFLTTLFKIASVLNSPLLPSLFYLSSLSLINVTLCIFYIFILVTVSSFITVKNYTKTSFVGSLLYFQQLDD